MTKISDVYDTFLREIADYQLIMGNMTDEEVEDELFGYLKPSIAKFHQCRKSLEIEKDDVQGDSFKEELDYFEVQVLATLMIVEYLKPKVLSGVVLRPALSDKSFEIYSQANHLRELNLLYRMFRTEARKMITEYSYLSLGDDKK